MISSLLGDLLKLYDESILRERIRTNLVDWATDVLTPSGLLPATHHRFLLSHLDLVAKGEIRRLLVLMPPGSAKSTYTSVVFPIWWLIQHPRSSVIAASNTAALVEHFSRRIRRLIEDNQPRIGFSLIPGDRSASHWRTSEGGEYFAVGVRGAITGRRADLAIIDDPVKSMAEADSPRYRQHIWDWFTAELMTRLKPDGRIVVVMTRWHEQDLGGQLLSANPDEWRVLRLPALAEENDPMGRPPGAALWPEWENGDALALKKAAVGSRVWSALFQQSPDPPERRLFDTHSIRIFDDAEAVTPLRAVRAWDLAATAATGQNDPDWTVGLKLLSLEGGRYLIEDVTRFRDGYQQVQDAIVSTARTDGHAVIVSLPIDPGQAGKSQVGVISSRLAGFRVFASREAGAKLSRAIPVAAQLDAGHLSIKRAGWNRAFLDELAAFPGGSKDDQVDALSRAFNTLLEAPGHGRQLFVPFTAR
jgi:predicted phage terminase large subunit-like protein